MNTPATEPLARLVAELEKLPGIGTRTAERLAYHILKIDREEAMRLARAIRNVKERLGTCEECFNIADGDLCAICKAPRRDRARVCVVEQVRDLIAVEKSGAWDGVYHVLQGRVSPHEGHSAEHTTLAALRKRLEKLASAGPVEVLLATNPDAEGETTALVVSENIEDLGVRVTRLARGLPRGGSLEFANVEIIRDAFSGRS